MGSEFSNKEKRRQSHGKIWWSTFTPNITNRPSEELLHVNAQYLSPFVSGKTAVWSTIILHFFKKGAFRAQLWSQPGAERYHSWTQVSTLSWHPLPALVFSPPKPKELSFGAEQLCVHQPNKGFPTSVCDSCKAETLLPWYLAELTLSWTEIGKFPLCFTQWQSQTDFKIMSSGYCEVHICFSFWIWPKMS